MFMNNPQDDISLIELAVPTGNGPAVVPDPLWTVEELAEYLKLQPETIRSMARRGELPAIKLGKVWRFQKGAIDEILISKR